MIRDYIQYGEKNYLVSTTNINGVLETMIFPINGHQISGNEVYCFRACTANESLEKYKDILENESKYLSDEAITNYIQSKYE